MRKILLPSFFNRDTKKVAEELLGKFIVRKINGKELSSMIIETEAYDGFEDMASHAHKGKTKRTEIMFGKPGYLYVYLCYGIHFMLNIVTREEEYPGAVLIRGVEDASGPGRVTKYFTINKLLNNKLLSKETGIWIEDRGIKIPKNKIIKSPRIGINYAGPIWSQKEWRFTIK